jgi:glycosyltransferase involved in cell wall biosynthesis
MAPHICVVANTTWYTFNFRGRLIAELLARGYRVTVLAPMDEYAERITALGARHVPLPLNNAGTNPFSELMTVIRIGNLLRRITPTVMLTYTPKVNIYASLAARLLGIPVIANVSGLGRAFTAGGWLEAVVRRLYWFALRTPRIVFFQNEDDLEEFVRSGLVKRGKAARIPGSGVDLERFAATTNTRHDNECRFLFSSRLLWDKGLAEYVKAARVVTAAAPHTRFLLLGFLDVANPSAVPRDQVERWHREGIVDYLGYTDDVVSQLAAVDCVVLPSFYREGVPRSLLEAASMGLPVITTDTPGCRDVVEDGVTGYLCSPRDAGDLAEKMMRIAALSSEKRTAMGAAGREKMVREFDERRVIKRYLDALSVVLGGEERGARAKA